jgi:hypothetical protein
MCRNMVSVAAAATVVLVLLAGLQCADAERKTKGDVNLRDCDPDNDGYYPPPSPSNCPKIIKVVPKGAKVYPICKAQGGNVNGDKWWLYVVYTAKLKAGFVADYYVDCGGVVCPYPVCSQPLFT